SALILGVSCLEELGKSKMYLSYKGKNPLVQTIQDEQMKHALNLSLARTIAPVTHKDLKRLSFLTNPEADPNSAETQKEYGEWQKVIAVETENRKKKIANDPHQNKRTQYVDITDSGTWTRPSETTQDEALKLLLHAVVEYSAQLGKFRTQPDGEKLTEQCPDRVGLTKRVFDHFLDYQREEILARSQKAAAAK